MVLGRLADPSAIELIETLLGDPHGEVRRQAVLAAGYLQAEALRERIAHLEKADASAKVRSAAEEALTMMRPPPP
jgi:HEAT repeat protein